MKSSHSLAGLNYSKKVQVSRSLVGSMWIAYRHGHWEGGRPALVTSHDEEKRTVNICVTMDIERDEVLLGRSYMPVPKDGGGAGVHRSFSKIPISRDPSEADYAPGDLYIRSMVADDDA